MIARSQGSSAARPVTESEAEAGEAVWISEARCGVLLSATVVPAAAAALREMALLVAAPTGAARASRGSALGSEAEA
jgi:hypothetical protein